MSHAMIHPHIGWTALGMSENCHLYCWLGFQVELPCLSALISTERWPYIRDTKFSVYLEDRLKSFPSMFNKCLWGPFYGGASLVAQTVKNLHAKQETRVQSLGWEDPLEKGRATPSSNFAWKAPWTKEPGGLVNGVAESWTWLKRLSTQGEKSQPWCLDLKTSISLCMVCSSLWSWAFIFIFMWLRRQYMRNFLSSPFHT